MATRVFFFLAVVVLVYTAVLCAAEQRKLEKDHRRHHVGKSVKPAEANLKTHVRSNKFTLTDADGNKFEFDRSKIAASSGSYRSIPTTLCPATSIAYSTASNQAAFKAAHDLLRSNINSCTYSLPKPTPPLAMTVTSTALAAMANSWSQNISSNPSLCPATTSPTLVHSSQTQRTVSYTLDNGTQVVNQYTGENLCGFGSICVPTDDAYLSMYNSYQSQYCNSGYLYTQASNSWWNSTWSTPELNQYIAATPKNTNGFAASPPSGTGHFTQMAWGSSTVIAGAAAECQSQTTTVIWNCSPKGVGSCDANGNMAIPSRCYSFIVAGRYGPGGNWAGQDMYTSTSQCPASG